MPAARVGPAMAWTAVLEGLWLFLPAYVANMAPVFAAKLLPRWSAPIDGGRNAKDGLRVLGPGKTWRGLAGGAVAGAGVAVLLSFVASGVFADGDFGRSAGSPVWAIALFGGLVGATALVGDAVKSYFKRRRGKARGQPWVPFDQLDFVVFGLLAVAVGSPLLADGWVRHAFLDDWLVLATIVVLTPGLHFLVNVIGYWLKLKDVPW
jgi:CDP-2,3-bis-(O-geranylgeranyl)-sn-glycerol synthase